MHPVYNKVSFGVHGVQIKFYNGSSAVSGYIVRQLGQLKYIVTDGTSTNGVLNTWTCTLAQTSAQATSIGSGQPTIFAIPLSSPLPSASGATLTPTFTLDALANNSFVSGGTGATTGNSFTLDGGVRATAAITITNFANLVASTSTLTIAGTTFTWISGASTGTSVQIGASNNATAANLQTALALGTPSTVYSYVSGNVVYVFARATATASIAVTTNAPTAISSTAAGNTAAIAGTPSAVTVTASAGNVSALASVATVGAWTTLPAVGVLNAYYAGYGVMPLVVRPKFALPTGTSSIAGSGGTGYAVNDILTFSGFTDLTSPQAVVSAVSGGAVTQVNVTTAGTGITVAGTIGITGTIEYVKVLFDTQCITVAGVKRYWALGASFDGGAVIPRFS